MRVLFIFQGKQLSTTMSVVRVNCCLRACFPSSHKYAIQHFSNCYFFLSVVVFVSLIMTTWLSSYF